MKLFLCFILLLLFSSLIKAISYGEKMDAPGGMKKIDLVYFHDFTNQNYWDVYTPADCFFVFDSSAATGFTFKPVLRCTEYISLLRSEVTIAHWQREQDQYGFFMFNLPDTGIYHVHAGIKSISPSASSLNGNPLISGSLISKNSSTVTGVFKRHSSSVKSWLFKTLSTGKLSTIHATPTHRFYVKYLNKWLPLSEITSDMTLIDDQNNAVSLVCDRSGQHCGIPWHPGRVTAIYNLEVYKKHDYFAGEQMLLVHNCGRSSMKLRALSIFKTRKTDAGSLPAPDQSKSVFQSASSKIIRVLRNEDGTGYHGHDDFFASVERAVGVYNDEMRGAGLPHMTMDFRVEQKLDVLAEKIDYHALTFSLHDNPENHVAVPFTRVKVIMKDGRCVAQFNPARPCIDIGYVMSGDWKPLCIRIGLVDNKPSDPVFASRAYPLLFEPLFSRSG